jgi:hypothetical protein
MKNNYSDKNRDFNQMQLKEQKYLDKLPLNFQKLLICINDFNKESKSILTIENTKSVNKND